MPIPSGSEELNFTLMGIRRFRHKKTVETLHATSVPFSFQKIVVYD